MAAQNMYLSHMYEIRVLVDIIFLECSNNAQVVTELKLQSITKRYPNFVPEKYFCKIIIW